MTRPNPWTRPRIERAAQTETFSDAEQDALGAKDGLEPFRLTLTLRPLHGGLRGTQEAKRLDLFLEYWEVDEKGSPTHPKPGKGIPCPDKGVRHPEYWECDLITKIEVMWAETDEAGKPTMPPSLIELFGWEVVMDQGFDDLKGWVLALARPPKAEAPNSSSGDTLPGLVSSQPEGGNIPNCQSDATRTSAASSAASGPAPALSGNSSAGQAGPSSPGTAPV